VRQQKVIKTPANVLGPGIHHVSPKSVSIGSVGVEVPEAVGQWYSLQQFPKTLTLLWSEASILFVSLGVTKVDFFMSHVEVPT
jgi:hypothetical protein